jgi:hypothetical protein
MTEVSYAPRAQVAAWLRKGWRLVDGHIYEENDWAVVMILPGIPVELSDDQIERIARRFQREEPVVIVASSNSQRVGKLLSLLKRTPERWRHTCTIPGCSALVNARGWCNLHYGRWRRTGDPLAVTMPNVSAARQRSAAKMRCEAVAA